MTQIKIIYLGIHKIKPYELNNKRHPEAQLIELSEMIKKYGFIKPILVDESYIILAGHGAFEAGKLAGLVEIPCVVLSHLSDAEKIAYRMADNKISEKSIWDFDNVAVEVARLVEFDFELNLTGFDDTEIEAILKDNIGVLPDSVADATTKVKGYDRKSGTPKKTRPIVRAGDKFALDGIQIWCKDADSAADCEWLIRRWMERTDKVAIHNKGMDFNTLADARK